MKAKEINDIEEFFSKPIDVLPDQKWDSIFYSWVEKIEEKSLMLSLFELKIWFESLENYITSPLVENYIYESVEGESKNYSPMLYVFYQITGRLIVKLKELDIKKDSLVLNFEEFISEKLLETCSKNTFPFLKDFNTPESWFYSLRLYLKNIRIICKDLLKCDFVSQRTFIAIKKLFHKELMSNPIIVSLLKLKFIPRLDKIYKKEISDIILNLDNKIVKRNLSIFYIICFRLIKINKFVDDNLNRTSNLEPIVPLIFTLCNHYKNVSSFLENRLIKVLNDNFEKKTINKVLKVATDNFKNDFNKIYQGELPFLFVKKGVINRKKLLKNIVLVSEMALQDLVKSVSLLFNPKLKGEELFDNYIDRKERLSDLNVSLKRLYDFISRYFEALSSENEISREDVLFEVNLFMEKDISYLLYKDWDAFIKIYEILLKEEKEDGFNKKLRSFKIHMAKIRKELTRQFGKDKVKKEEK